ncbi:MAG: hypothetical protein ACKPKO_03645, partial [Candidatus Fonsibacter sp.]
LQRERRRRLAEALRVLSPSAPEAQIAEDPEDSLMGWNLVDLHRATPQSWFNTALYIMIYRSDDIPEETYLTHVLVPSDPEHAEILQRQKVTRSGLYRLFF